MHYLYFSYNFTVPHLPLNYWKRKYNDKTVKKAMQCSWIEHNITSREPLHSVIMCPCKYYIKLCVMLSRLGDQTTPSRLLGCVWSPLLDYHSQRCNYSLTHLTQKIRFDSRCIRSQIACERLEVMFDFSYFCYFEYIHCTAIHFHLTSFKFTLNAHNIKTIQSSIFRPSK